MKKLCLLLFLCFLSGITCFAQNTNNNNCDVITLKNGQLVYGKVVDVKKGMINYIPCNDNAAPIKHLAADSATMISHPDGSYSLVKGSSVENTGEDKANEMIAINGGIAIPISNASTSVLGYSSGPIALSGPDVNICFSKYFENSKFGFSILTGYTVNDFDFNSYFQSTEYNFTLGTIYTLNNYTPSSFTNLKLLLGPLWSVPFNNSRIGLDFRLLLGVFITHYTGTSYDYTAQFNSSTFQNIEGVIPAVAFMQADFDLGVGIHFPLSERIYAQVSADFLYSFLSEDVGGPYNTFGNPFSLFNATGGLAYRIGN